MPKFLLATKTYIVLLFAAFIVTGWWAWAHKGPTVFGNVLAFIGNLALVVPPIRQMIGNGFIDKLARDVKNDGDRESELALRSAQIKQFVAFNRTDGLLVLAGLLLSSIGFLWGLIVAPTI